MPDFRLFLEFTSLSDFAAFCALLRGEELDEDKIRAMTARLQSSTAKLTAAEHKDSQSAK